MLRVDVVLQIAYGDPPPRARECMDAMRRTAEQWGVPYHVLTTLPEWYRYGMPLRLVSDLVRFETAARTPYMLYCDWDAYAVSLPEAADRPLFENDGGRPHHGIFWTGGNTNLFAAIHGHLLQYRNAEIARWQGCGVWPILRVYRREIHLFEPGATVHLRLGKQCR
jgi:hypothetical protein